MHNIGLAWFGLVWFGFEVKHIPLESVSYKITIYWVSMVVYSKWHLKNIAVKHWFNLSTFKHGFKHSNCPTTPSSLQGYYWSLLFAKLHHLPWSCPLPFRDPLPSRSAFQNTDHPFSLYISFSSSLFHSLNINNEWLFISKE